MTNLKNTMQFVFINIVIYMFVFRFALVEKNNIFGISQLWVWFLALLLISSVASVKLINPSEYPVPISNTVYFAGGCGGLVSEPIYTGKFGHEYVELCRW